MESNFSNLNLFKASEISQEELLAEAKAWGFETVEEWVRHMDEAYAQADSEQLNQ